MLVWLATVPTRTERTTQMAYNKRNNDGGAKNRDKELAERDSRATEMRRTKQRAKKGHTTGNGGGTSLFEEIYNERRKAAQEAAEERRIAAEERALAFRQKQSAVAKASVTITGLKGISAKVAVLIIEAFPDTDAYTKSDGKKVSRTAASTESALAELSDLEIQREGAVKYGVSSARQALNNAYIALTKASG